jgi:hypothetical protein
MPFALPQQCNCNAYPQMIEAPMEAIGTAIFNDQSWPEVTGGEPLLNNMVC